jgi:hypothetical protein
MIAGQKIKFTGVGCKEQIQWGGNTNPEGVLKENEIYTIKDVDVRSWSTRIYLKGIDGYFNIVWFEVIK